MKRAIVTGAGGFICWHLCKYLDALGYEVRGVDKKYPELASPECSQFALHDLRDPREAHEALRGAENAEVYHLAADMGGIGFISEHLADCALNNSMIDNAVVGAVLHHGCKTFTYTSSACVYRQDVQSKQFSPSIRMGDKMEDCLGGGELVTPAVAPKLTEGEHDWPADPEPGYGMQKLYTEKLLEYVAKDRGLNVRIARPHNVYGPYGTYDGGREKAPAALCRKFATMSTQEIWVWGDGYARRSFLYVDDFVRGLHLLGVKDPWDHSLLGPINLGHEHDVSIRELAQEIRTVSEKLGADIHYEDDGGPQGVRVRGCNAAKAKKYLGWEPEVGLEEGLKKTYEWIAKEVADG